MIKSLGAYIFGVFKRIYWLLFSLLLDPLDIVHTYTAIQFNPPLWTFWLGLVVCFSVASFLTYYDVWRKLDEIGGEFFFEPTGNDLTTVTGSVLLNVSFRAKPNVIVDKLELEINGLRFQPSKWNPIKVSPQYTDTWTFDLAEKLEQEKTYAGKLIATVNSKPHESREFKVHL
jgi:hypothetical protein